MNISLTPRQQALGWIEEINDDRAKQLGIADGSIAVYYRDSGRIRVEILPPIPPELKSEIENGFIGGFPKAPANSKIDDEANRTPNVGVGGI